jgi:hypothetical protein
MNFTRLGPLLLAGSLVSLAGAIASRLELQARSAVLQHDLSRLRIAAELPKPDLMPQADFAQSLPIDAKRPEDLVRQAPVEDDRLRVTSLSTSIRDATPQTLGRQTFAITLQGSYSNTKRALAEITDRGLGVVVESVKLRSVSPGGDLQGEIVVSQLQAPLRDGPPRNR